jgi:hypothetical protein
MNSSTGNATLARVVTKLLAHAGFQGAQASALAVMTDITIDFFLNLGRALRGFSDLYNKTMTAEVRTFSISSLAAGPIFSPNMPQPFWILMLLTWSF